MEQKLLSSFCLNRHSRKLRYLYTAGAFFNLNKEEFLYIFIYIDRSLSPLYSRVVYMYTILPWIKRLKIIEQVYRIRNWFLVCYNI